MEDNNMRDVLGLPQLCEDFADGKPRRIIPMTMDKFPDFMENFAMINVKRLWNNYMYVGNQMAIDKVFEMSMPDYDLDEIKKSIHAGNYPKIINMIMNINGIELAKPTEDEEGKNDPEV